METTAAVWGLKRDFESLQHRATSHAPRSGQLCSWSQTEARAESGGLRQVRQRRYGARDRTRWFATRYHLERRTSDEQDISRSIQGRFKVNSGCLQGPYEVGGEVHRYLYWNQTRLRILFGARVWHRQKSEAPSAAVAAPQRGTAHTSRQPAGRSGCSRRRTKRMDAHSCLQVSVDATPRTIGARRSRP